jgi:hypothetical protein
VHNLKPGQNIFQLHHFLNTFLQLAAEKKFSKNGAAGNFFGPSYFVTALPFEPKPEFIYLNFLLNQRTLQSIMEILAPKILICPP